MYKDFWLSAPQQPLDEKTQSVLLRSRQQSRYIRKNMLEPESDNMFFANLMKTFQFHKLIFQVFTLPADLPVRVENAV